MVKYLIEEVDAKYGIDPAAIDNWAIRIATGTFKLIHQQMIILPFRWRNHVVV